MNNTTLQAEALTRAVRVRRDSVVTYQHAYLSRWCISLCDRHATDDHSETRARGVVLGPVTHGRHWGTCEICSPPYED